MHKAQVRLEAGESSVGIDFDSKGGELHLGLVDNHINSTLGIARDEVFRSSGPATRFTMRFSCRGGSRTAPTCGGHKGMRVALFERSEFAARPEHAFSLT
jgi:hypothetical protein